MHLYVVGGLYYVYRGVRANVRVRAVNFVRSCNSMDAWKDVCRSRPMYRRGQQVSLA